MGNESSKEGTMESSDKVTICEQERICFANWLIGQLIKLAAVWNEPMPQLRQEVYVEYLSEINRCSLEKAFQRAFRECKKFPSIAELRQMAPPEYLSREQVEARQGEWVKELEARGVIKEPGKEN
jgi:hypothetical protein